MAKLDDDVVAGLYFIKHLLPASFLEERQRGAPVGSMIVYHDIVVKEALKRHTPPALQLSFRKIFISRR